MIIFEGIESKEFLIIDMISDRIYMDNPSYKEYEFEPDVYKLCEAELVTSILEYDSVAELIEHNSDYFTELIGKLSEKQEWVLLQNVEHSSCKLQLLAFVDFKDGKKYWVEI